ncbi:MAG: oxalate:formate antiporter [Marinilabiliales bacterium]|nr:MAG: oxalate:formate antiporter [Marinilabiliales bacterium]
MTEKIKQTLRDNKAARWTALAIVAFTMLCGYFFTEIISPLKPLMESELGWSSSDFGLFTGAYAWFNVFLFMLIIVGIILDKVGMRISAIASAVIMVIGALVKYWAINSLSGDVTAIDINLFGNNYVMSQQLLWACLGYAIFGVGVEFAGITVSRIIVKWFKGKEMALAMGLEMACARLGTFAAMAFSPVIVSKFDIPQVILIGGVLLAAGLIFFIIYFFMDIKLDKSMDDSELDFSDEKFELKDIGKIVVNPGFWLLALLCVLFYSAVFPFYKFGTDLVFNKFGVPMENGMFLGFIPKGASIIPSLLPFGTLFLTPIFGNIYDKKGKGASIMILGAVLLIIAHVVLWIPSMNSVIVAILMVILIGIAFSLVPSAMWPSVPKIIAPQLLGTAYALIFFIQNIGLMIVPTLLGTTLDKTNPNVVERMAYFKATGLEQGIVRPEAQAIFERLSADGTITSNVTNLTSGEMSAVITELRAESIIPAYDYTQTWMIFVVLSVAALGVAILLKAVDKKKGYGLEKSNIEK